LLRAFPGKPVSPVKEQPMAAPAGTEAKSGSTNP
jgi:hypothetical protein